MKLHLILLTSLSASLLLSSCKSETSTTDTSPEASAQSPLTHYLLAEEPANAVPVAALFVDPTPGTEIVVTGEVMGRLEPFVENRAMLVMGDPAELTPCNRIEDDECETPWDVCCDDPEVIKKSIATIQIVDENQRPLHHGLKGFGGLQELTTLTVVGTIAEGSNAENLLINATGIHVGQQVEL